MLACPTSSFDNLIRLGRQSARHNDVRDSDLDDCAIEFAEQMMCGSRSRPPNTPDESESRSWLRVCARNFAHNFARTRSRLCAHELCEDSTPGMAGDQQLETGDYDDQNPQVELMHS